MTDPSLYPINPDEELEKDESPGSLFVNRKSLFLQLGPEQGVPEPGEVQAKGQNVPQKASQSYVTDVDAAGNLINISLSPGDTYTCSTMFRGLLDNFGNASVALSLRRLSGQYTGNLIRVRRDSDDDELEIGFNSSGLLDTVSLLAFVGAGDGFVTRWYNQAVAGEYYEEGVLTGTPKPPRIVSSGAIVSDGATYPYPAIEFPGSRWMEGPVFTLDKQLSTYVVASVDSLFGVNNIFYDNGNNATYGGGYHMQQSALGTIAAYAQDINDVVLGTGSVGGVQMQIAYTADNNNNQNLYKQGALLDTNSTAPAARDALAFGRVGRDRNFNYLDGKIQEIIAYPKGYPSNFYQISSLQNDFYQIY